MANRIAVWGAGSLGTVFGAHLALAGCDVTLIDSWTEHVEALNKNGASVEGVRNFTVPVVATTPDEVAGYFDIVFFLVKQTFLEEAFHQMQPHLMPNSIVCVMQNGLPETLVTRLSGGRYRVVGAPVGWGATLTQPGVSRLTSSEDSIHFMVGSDCAEDAVPIVKEHLELMCPTAVTPNLVGIRWSKLLMNCSFSGLSTALGCTFGDVLYHDDAMRVLIGLVNEGVMVAKAAGVSLVPMGGNDYEGALFCKCEQDVPKTIEAYREVWAGQCHLKASMLQDIEKGRPCEVDFINGVLVEEGARYGVPTPINAKVVELIRESACEGSIPNFQRNLNRLRLTVKPI